MEMISWGTENQFLPPAAAAAYLANSNWILHPSKSRSGDWMPLENKIFEKALAIHDKETPDRWQKVAEMLPGKTVEEVRRHYKDLEDDVSQIEAGLVPIPGYDSPSSFTLEWANGSSPLQGAEVFKQQYGSGCSKRGGGGVRASDQERKKGIPWTEEEHRLFLMGLKKYGKGDWRNISRNYVITRTPTQVASHAQKYFIRLSAGGKDKRRSSIHDITTINLPENKPPSPSESPKVSMHPNSVTSIKYTDQLPDQSKESAAVLNPVASFSQKKNNLFMQSSLGNNPYGANFDVGNLHSSLNESVSEHQNMLFQMKSGQAHSLH